MISHKVRQEVIRLGSLVVYFLWESPHVDIPIVQNFYWHDKSCTKSVGPFFSVTEAMQDYAEAKRAQKALQRRGLVQELHRTDGYTHHVKAKK